MLDVEVPLLTVKLITDIKKDNVMAVLIYYLMFSKCLIAFIACKDINN